MKETYEQDLWVVQDLGKRTPLPFWLLKSLIISLRAARQTAHLCFFIGGKNAKDVFYVPQEVLLTMEAALLLPHEHSQDICAVPAHPGPPALTFYLVFIISEIVLMYLTLLVEPLTWKKAHLSNACGSFCERWFLKIHFILLPGSDIKGTISAWVGANNLFLLS